MAAGELESIDLLVTDCQTTGSSPEKGHLLEAAWVRASAGDDVAALDVRSVLAQLPEDEVLPPRITRLTGITPEMMDEAKPSGEIWKELKVAADQSRCLAHFASFEERFYSYLHDSAGFTEPFPLTFICTHHIACRLLPDLPRRGMRALAGYFGHPLPELKRAAEHVRATFFIWQKLVEMLREQGVITIDQLDELLARPKPPRGKQWVVPMDREERLALSSGPGVYRFINAAGSVIYVGKATSLKSRVNSYYRKRKKAEKELEIVSQASRIETEPTESSLEAALLESVEIKRLDPPYNTALRDVGRAFGTAEDVARLADETGYPLGRSCPVTDINLVSNWFRLVDGLASGELHQAVAEETWHTLWLDHHAPCDPELFEEGTELFLATHGLKRDPLLARGLRTRGRDLLLEMRERQRQEREERAAGALGEEEEQEELEKAADAEEPEDEEKEVEVTPELVAGRLTGLTMTVGHQFRKGRWLALLAGAEVCWDQRTGDDRRIVTLPAEPPDVLDQYDLLRVLTTEVRRLIRDGRNPEIRLRRGRGLAGDQLVRILELV
jgi:DNA polymerase-3 subunit epsilon